MLEPVMQQVDDPVDSPAEAGQVPRQQLPEGLVDLPPGAELASLLAGLDLSRLNGHDLIAVAPVILKQISCYQAMLAETGFQVLHCPAGDADSAPQRVGHTNEWARVDLAAGLRWSTAKAEHELRFAYQLHRLPMLREALAGGELDIARVRTIVQGLLFVDDEPARLLAGSLLRAGAAGWTSRQISDRLRRAVLAFDPDASTRRQRQAQAHRGVQVQPHMDGTVSVHAVNLPPDRVAAMLERITAIARVAKRNGDRRTIHQLRADIMCDLIAGTGIGAVPPGPVTNPGPTGLSKRILEQDLPDDEAADDGQPTADQPGEQAGEPAPVPLPALRPGTVTVNAWLSTLLGRSDEPGELEGVGPVTAQVIRKIISEHPDLRWRLSLFDDLTGCDGSCGCDGTCHSNTGPLAWHGSLHTGAGRSAPPADTADPPPADGFSATDIAFLRARDRTCRGPQACPVPATGSDMDHTIARADGGPDTADNGGPECRRDHRYKHHSGARLRQTRPGIFEWTTQYGHTIVIQPQTPAYGTGPPPRTAAERLAQLLPRAEPP